MPGQQQQRRRRPRPQSLQQPIAIGTDKLPARPAVAPHRFFIRDAILRQFAQDNDERTSNASSSGAGLYVRLMGVVNSSSPNARSRSAIEENSFNCNLQQDSSISFVIEDGTASVEVVRQSPPTHASTGPIPMHNKRPKLDGGNYVGGSINQTQAVVGEMPHLGSLVDCVGYLTLPAEARAPAERNATDTSASGMNDRDEGQKDDEEEQAPLNAQSLETTAAAEGEVPTCACATSSSRLPVLNAVSVTTMSNPDAESLRTLEMLLSSSAASAEKSEGSSSEEDVYRSSNRNFTGIHIAGDLLSIIGAFQPCSTDGRSSSMSSVGGNDNMKPPPPASGSGKTQAQAPYTISSDTVFRLIKSAASDGGLAEEDLGIALGCHSIDPNGTIRRGARNGDVGTAAVREVLQGLQFDGEIYKTGRGTYLPL